MIANCWTECALGDLVQVKHGFAFLGEYFGSVGTHIVLTPGNFFETGGFKEKTEKRKWYRGPVPTDYVLNEGDVIVAMTEQAEGLLGSSAVIPASGLYLHNQRLGLVRVRDQRKADLGFIYYLFNSEAVRQQIRGSASGTKIRHTAPSRIEKVRVCVPPVSMQRRIAGILSAYDELIENSQRRIHILETMARSLYREWFVNFRFPGHEKVRRVTSALGEIPEGWRLQPVKSFGRVLTGKTPSKADDSYYGNDVPFVKTPDMHENIFVLFTADRLSQAGAESQSNKWIPSGSICVSCIGTIGVVSLITEACHTNQQINSIVPTTPECTEFLFFRLQDARRHLENLGANGATMGNVNKSKFEEMEIITPPPSLLKEYNRLVYPMFSNILRISRMIQSLRHARDLLLPRLLSGQIHLNRTDQCSTDRITSVPEKTSSAFVERITKLELLKVTPVPESNSSACVERSPSIDDIDRTDVLCAIRTLFADGVERDRNTAIRELAHALGYQRTGSRIYDGLSTDLLTSTRRGIIVRDGGAYRLGFRSVAECTRDSLKGEFESAVGRGWISRDEAARAFARWLGFGRVGKVIDDTIRSLINGLIREDRLESDGNGFIRRR